MSILSKKDKNLEAEAQPKKQDKKAEAAAQSKKQDKKAEVAAQPKKQDKKVETVVQPKKQEKNTEAAPQPKKQDKNMEVDAQPQKQDKKVEAPVQPQKQEKKVEVAAQPKKTSSSHDKAKAVYVDEAVGVLTVELMRGDGWYEKGLSKKDFFQCVIEVGFEGNGKYELKGAQVFVYSLRVNNYEIQDLVKSGVITVKAGINELDIEIDRQGMRNFLADTGCDNVNRLSTEVGVSVTAMVKSGPKTKKLPCDVYCIF